MVILFLVNLLHNKHIQKQMNEHKHIVDKKWNEIRDGG